MTESSGGVGKPYDFTQFNLFRESSKIDKGSGSLDDAAATQAEPTKPAVEKDILDWKLGTNLYGGDQKDKLKQQIKNSQERLAENRKEPGNTNKTTRFIGKVTYELEGHPDLSKFSIDDLA